jgi:hypothetical protein
LEVFVVALGVEDVSCDSIFAEAGFDGDLLRVEDVSLFWYKCFECFKVNGEGF